MSTSMHPSSESRCCKCCRLVADRRQAAVPNKKALGSCPPTLKKHFRLAFRRSGQWLRAVGVQSFHVACIGSSSLSRCEPDLPGKSTVRVLDGDFYRLGFARQDAEPAV